MIIGVNYLGDFDIERREQRPWDDPAYDEDGRCCHGVICRTSCRFGLPEIQPCLCSLKDVGFIFLAAPISRQIQ